MLASLETYSSTSNGNYPDSTTAIATWQFQSVVGQYQNPDTGGDYNSDGDLFNDCTGNADGSACGPEFLSLPIIDTDEYQYAIGATCGDAGRFVSVNQGRRSVAVRMGLEEGVYCQDNQ